MTNKILIIGCGSIGARHARNAQALGAALVLADTSEGRRTALAAELGAGTASSIEEAFERYPDITCAVVATPSIMHPAHTRACVERGIPVLVEKPLGASSEGLSELAAEAEDRGVVAMIAQSYRFHPGLRYAKERIDAGAIGKVFSASYAVGQYLPDWHPSQDYRKEYTAKKSLGGGILLTNMSHVFDTVGWLFGDIDQVSGWLLRLGDLELEAGVEDTALCLLHTVKGIAVSASADFLARIPRHILHIEGSEGSIDADLIARTITIMRPAREPETHTYEADSNAHYVEELRHFFSLVEHGTVRHELDLRHGARIVALLTDPRITPANL